MKLYNYLEIPKNATNYTIKKSYRKLARKYHPDKPGGDEEQFKKIQFAYEILSNKDSRLEYDKTIKNDITLYDFLNNTIKDNNLTFISNFIDIFYDDVNDLKNDINSLNLKNFFNKMKTSIGNDLDIIQNINYDFKDIYNGIYKKITFSRFINSTKIIESVIINPDPYNQEFIWEKKGDRRNNVIGDLIIKINIINNKFTILDDYNLLLEVNIFDNLKLPNNMLVEKNYNNIIKHTTNVIFEYKGLGLLCLDTNERGSLFIKAKTK